MSFERRKSEAVHWRIYEIARIGDYVAKKPTATIACGYAGDSTTKLTENTMSITCKPCAEMAKERGFKTPLGEQTRMF